MCLCYSRVFYSSITEKSLIYEQITKAAYTNLKSFSEKCFTLLKLPLSYFNDFKEVKMLFLSIVSKFYPNIFNIHKPE